MTKDRRSAALPPRDDGADRDAELRDWPKPRLEATPLNEAMTGGSTTTDVLPYAVS